MHAAIPLYLSPGFGRPVFTGGYNGFSKFTFPGGEEHIKLDPEQDWAADLLVERQD